MDKKSEKKLEIENILKVLPGPKAIGPAVNRSNETMSLLRKSLKMLLYRLALQNENPSIALESLLQEVIGELYQEAKATLEERKSHLSVIRG